MRNITKANERTNADLAGDRRVATTSCSVSRSWELIQSLAGAVDFFPDVFGFLGPHERFRTGVVVVDLVANRLFQGGDAFEDAVANAVLRQVAEPAFDHDQPGTARRRGVQMKPRMPLRPRQHVRVLVHRVIIEDQMQAQLRRRLCVDVLQKLDPFLVPMPRQAIRNDFAFGQFDGGEQRGGPVAVVVVRERLQAAGGNSGRVFCVRSKA